MTAMIRLLWAASVYTRYFMRRYMPTNILLDAIRTRRGLEWGIPAMLLAIPYLLIANVCVLLIDEGGPGWLHLVVLWALWNMLRMLWIGPISVFLLIRARLREAVAARRDKVSRSPIPTTSGGVFSRTERSMVDEHGDARDRSSDVPGRRHEGRPFQGERRNSRIGWRDVADR